MGGIFSSLIYWLYSARPIYVYLFTRHSYLNLGSMRGHCLKRSNVIGRVCISANDLRSPQARSQISELDASASLEDFRLRPISVMGRFTTKTPAPQRWEVDNGSGLACVVRLTGHAPKISRAPPGLATQKLFEHKPGSNAYHFSKL